MGKSTISMAIFNSYVKLPEGNSNFADAMEHSSGLILIRSLEYSVHIQWICVDKSPLSRYEGNVVNPMS
jgi:hypothetical protein